MKPAWEDRLRLSWRAAAILLAVGHTWAAIRAGSMNEDGISYLDMGDAFLRGDWAMAVNAVWSPLYAIILGTSLRIARPSVEWEFAVVHVTNFLIFVFALVCFEFYWKQLVFLSDRNDRAVHHDPASSGREAQGSMGLPWWAWLSVGYGLFIWSTFSLVRLWAVTPDMLVAGLVFLAAGLLLRLEAAERGDRGRVLLGVGLGASLGLGYLAKAVMLPVAVLFVALTGLLAWRSPKMRAAAGLAVVTLVLVAGPWVASVSSAEGHPTIGEAGRLTYLRYVNGVAYPFWKPGIDGTGEPEHAPRLLGRNPDVYEFASPVPGTYALGYDPAYWYRGVRPSIRPSEQARALLSNGLFYAGLFGRELGGVAAAILILLLLRGRKPREASGFLGPAGLAAIGLAVLGLYGLVYVEGRYIAPFVVLLIGGLLFAVRLPRGSGYRRALSAGGNAMIVFLALTIGSFNAQGLLQLLGAGEAPRRSSSWSVEEASSQGSTSGGADQVEAALGHAALGINPGDEIAFVGYAFGAYFARLARVRITRQIPDEAAAAFWTAGMSSFDVMAGTLLEGKPKAIVTDGQPTGPSAGRWSRLGNSGYWIFLPHARLLNRVSP